MTQQRIAILGTGNIGSAIARGLAECGRFDPSRITLTRRKTALLDRLAALGFVTHDDNCRAVRESEVILLAVEPHQTDGLLREIGGELDPNRHRLISVMSGVTLAQLRGLLTVPVQVIRAMPNTAIAIRESMTCLASEGSADDALAAAEAIFGSVGQTRVIDEEQMSAATALGACGIAFFLRAIRAASQGGIEAGLNYTESLAIAAQTARGAASLLLARADHHPEQEIDRVTTPRGCTIAGLNQMEHEGFSSALIKGITTSANKAGTLYHE